MECYEQRTVVSLLLHIGFFVDTDHLTLYDNSGNHVEPFASSGLLLYYNDKTIQTEKKNKVIFVQQPLSTVCRGDFVRHYLPITQFLP